MAFNGLLGLGGVSNPYIGLLGDTLSGVGIGLLNQRPGESAFNGVGQGLQYANQLGQQRRQAGREDLRDQLAQQQFQLQQQAAAQQKAAFEQQQSQLAAQKAAAMGMFGGPQPTNQAGFRPGGAGPGASVPGAAQPPNPAFANMDPAQLAVMQGLAQASPEAALNLGAQQAFKEPAGPESSIGKLGADLKAGRITQAEYNALVRKETYIAPQEAKIPGITTLYDPQTMQPRSLRDNDPAIDQLLKAGWTEKGPGSSGITITNPDGTTTQIGGTAKAPNATQSTAAARGSLLATGIDAIKDVDMSKVSAEKMAAVGAGKSMLPNAAGGYLQAKALNAEEQKLLAGQGAITEAVTAAITGAAYAPAQLVNYQNIFVPAAGEDPAVTVGKLQRGAIFLKQLDEMAAGSRLPIDQLPPEQIRAAVDYAMAQTPQPAAAPAASAGTSGLTKEERKKKYGLEP